MAQEKPGKYEEFRGKFMEFATYQKYMRDFSDGKGHVQGDLEQLTQLWAQEMGKLGAKKEDITGQFDILKQYYNAGKKDVFMEPVSQNAKAAEEDYRKYSQENLDAIIDSTDEEYLGKVVFPLAVSMKYKSEGEKYQKVKKLHEEVMEMGKKYQEIKNPKTRGQAMQRLKEEKERYFETEYSRPDYKNGAVLKKIFKSLINPNMEAALLEEAFQEKQNEFNEAIGKDLKGYLKSMKIKPEDFAEIYARVFSEEAQDKEKAKKGGNGGENSD